MRIEKNMNEQQEQMIENSTKLLSYIVSSSSSSSSPDRSRTVINVIYVSGIVFMVIVFLVLLWINLYSRRCWCWHDTPLINRFNRQWLIKRSMNRHPSTSLSNNQQERRSLNDDELNS